MTEQLPFAAPSFAENPEPRCPCLLLFRPVRKSPLGSEGKADRDDRHPRSRRSGLPETAAPLGNQTPRAEALGAARLQQDRRRDRRPLKRVIAAVAATLLMGVTRPLQAAEQPSSANGPEAAFRSMLRAAAMHDEDAFRVNFDVSAVAIADAERMRERAAQLGLIYESTDPKFGDSASITTFESMVRRAVFEGHCENSELEDPRFPFWSWPDVLCLLGGQAGKVSTVRMTRLDGSLATLRVRFIPRREEPEILLIALRRKGNAWRVVDIIGLPELLKKSSKRRCAAMLARPGGLVGLDFSDVSMACSDEAHTPSVDADGAVRWEYPEWHIAMRVSPLTNKVLAIARETPQPSGPPMNKPRK
jgi:hypothetical protein